MKKTTINFTNGKYLELTEPCQIMSREAGVMVVKHKKLSHFYPWHRIERIDFEEANES